MTFFQLAAVSLMHGLRGQNYMSGQSKDALRVCNVKIRKHLRGHYWGTFPIIFGLTACSIK